MNRNIFVTGGAGYIGSHTCVELLNAGYHVTVFDNYCNSKPEAFNRMGVPSWWWKHFARHLCRRCVVAL